MQREQVVQQMEARMKRLEMENEILRKQGASSKEAASQFATPEEVPVGLINDPPCRETRDERSQWSQWWWPRPTVATMRDEMKADRKPDREKTDGVGDGRPGPSRGSHETTEVENLMKGMVKLMEGMQMMQSQILTVKRDKDVEVVRSGVSDLPRLPEWRVDTAPLDLTDWFLTIEPALGDLSDGSQQWWDGMLRAARPWYSLHQEMSPLKRVNHAPEAPPELKGMRYQRLEKRTAALLMAAIPAT